MRWVRLSSLPVLLAVVVLALSLTLGHLWNEDFWWYLASGERILDERSIPQHDDFLYPLAGQGGWVIHSWLWTVAVALLHRLAGLQGVAVFGALLVCGLLVTFFALGRLDRLGLINGSLATLVLVAGNQRLLLRAELTSLVLVALFVCLLERKEKLSSRSLAALLLLQWLWANLHGGFYLGILVVLAYTVGGRVKDCTARPPVWLVPALAGVSLLTPALLRGQLGYAFMVLSEHGYLSEWAPTFKVLSQREPWLWGVFLALGLTSFAGLRSPRWAARLILLAGFAVMGLTAVRFVPGFTIVATMVTILNLRDRESMWALPRTRAIRVAHTLAAAAFCVVAVGGAAQLWQARGDFDLGRSPAGWPMPSPVSTAAGAADYVLEWGVKGPILNDMELGGYLVHRLYPRHRLFIDSRQLDLPLVRRYIGLMTTRAQWGSAQVEYGFRAVVISNLATVSPLALRSFLLDDPRWRLVYLDPQAAVFVRAQPSVLPASLDALGPGLPFLGRHPSRLRSAFLKVFLRQDPRDLLLHYLNVLGDLRRYRDLDTLATRALAVRPGDAELIRLRDAARSYLIRAAEAQRPHGATKVAGSSASSPSDVR